MPRLAASHLGQRLARLLLSVMLAAGLAHASAAAAAPRVVATIAPIHSLAAALMQGVGEPRLLLPARASPHAFALRPSDARALAAADLVVWVGKPLETFLPGVLETSGAPALALLAAPGADPLPYPSALGAEGGEPYRLDPHVWLDPVRAQAIAAAIARRLAEIDPGNAALYRANAERLTARLAALDREIEARLAPVRDRSFVTFHDAFGYLVRRYGLSQAFGLTLEPERRPGARTMSRLRQRIAERGIACAFTEPQFAGRMVRRLAEETGLKLGRLDPLGAGIEPGPELYFTMMRANADAIADCLSGPGRRRE